jgi:hypothetical protein
VKTQDYYSTLAKEGSFYWASVATPVILATLEAEIKRITVQDQPRQKVHKIPSPK